MSDVLPTIVLGVALLFVVGAAGACANATNASPLSHGSISPDALAEVALEEFRLGNEDALNGLRISREEYETLLWPVLPDRNQVPFDFVWSLTEPRSRKALREVMGEYAGIPLELVKVELGKKVETYPGFTLYQDARMTVRRTDTGAQGLFPLMDVLVEMDGRWKFLNFGEDL